MGSESALGQECLQACHSKKRSVKFGSRSCFKKKLTMLKMYQKLLFIPSLAFLLLQAHLPALAKPAKNQALQVQSQASDIYKQAKADLPEDWYVIYRVVDRMARANDLDNGTWRVAVVPEYDINAFATENNLIAVYAGLLDQLGGDASAIACVVGHEMGHHVKRHQALSQAQEAALLASIQQEAQQQVNKEIQSANANATGSAVGSGILRAIGGLFGGLGSTIGNLGGLLIEGQSAQNQARAQQKINEIVATKQQELKQRLAETDRKQEFEADVAGYTYIARAGFDPQGCLRVMEVLGRTPGAEFDTSHPAVPKRIENLKQLMLQFPPQTLAQEGKANLASNPKPLTYTLSKDGASLRINSSQGGSAAETIDRTFGN